MACSQNVQVPILLLLWAGHVQMIQGSHPTSKGGHVCFDIYLERDYPFVDTIVKGLQQSLHGGRRIILEDQDLKSICQQIFKLHDCYAGLLKECGTYRELDRYQRLAETVGNVHFYLCGNSTDNMKDLLRNVDCLNRVNDYLNDCSDSGIRWFTTWTQILRMQVDAGDKCNFLDDYKMCFAEKVEKVSCDPKASQLYGRMMEISISSWCKSRVSMEDYCLSHDNAPIAMIEAPSMLVIAMIGLIEAVKSLV